MFWYKPSKPITMKIYHVLIFSVLTVFTSCGGKTTATLENTSPNGKAKLSINAKRAMPFDAWQVTMKVKAYDFKEGQLAFEAMADDISAETVSFNWVDENNCNITFKLRDNTERNFHLIASPTQVQMGEI